MLAFDPNGRHRLNRSIDGENPREPQFYVRKPDPLKSIPAEAK